MFFPRFLSTTLTCEAPSYLFVKTSATIRSWGNRRQHTRTEQDPDMPWHLQTRCIRPRTNRRPASLLCRFMIPSSEFLSSLESTKSRLYISPYLISSEQPPHCQCLGVRFLTRASQEHSLSSPLLQARATAWANAAEDNAWTNADSRDLYLSTPPKMSVEFSTVLQFHRLCRNWYWHSSTACWAPDWRTWIILSESWHSCFCLSTKYSNLWQFSQCNKVCVSRELFPIGDCGCIDAKFHQFANTDSISKSNGHRTL